MAKSLDPAELVSFKELLMVNSIQINALCHLLIEKEVISQCEFFKTGTPTLDSEQPGHPISENTHDITTKDLDDLKKAKALLENPSLAAKITNYLGTPIEKGFALLPENWNLKVGELTRTALSKAVQTAVITMKDSPGKEASNVWHKFAVATTGGVGGLFGLPALAIELPISTTIMLRSIADIARSEDEDIHNIESKIACIEVFALGGPSINDDSYESGYFAVRAALAHSVSMAAEYITKRGLYEKSAPALVRLITQIAQRFSIQVSEKAAAQAVPAIGAAGGAIINTLFIDHFQDMARGHFIVRRLERKYGEEIVKETYNSV